MSFTFAKKVADEPRRLKQTIDDRNASHNGPSLSTDSFWGRANSFRVPIGEPYGTGTILLYEHDLQSIDRTTWHDLKIFDDLGRYGTGPVKLQKITLVRAVHATPGEFEDTDGTYVCELADRRYHLARIPVDKAYNVRDQAGVSRLVGTLNAGAAWTWSEILADLCTTLGITVDNPSDPAPDSTPENLTYYGSFAWRALNDVLTRIGWTVVYNPILDTFKYVQLGEIPAESEAFFSDVYDFRVSDGYFIDPSFAAVPEKVRVKFNRRPMPVDGNSPFYFVDVATDVEGVKANTTIQIEDDLTAIGAHGTPSNSGNLTTRAEERASDWLRRRQDWESPQQYVWVDYHKGMLSLLGGDIAAVGWCDRGEGMLTFAEARIDGKMEAWKPGMSTWGLPSLWAKVVASAGNGSHTLKVVDEGNKAFPEVANASNFTAWEVNLGNANVGSRVRVFPDQRGNGGWGFVLSNGTGGGGGNCSDNDCGVLSGLSANSCLYANITPGSGNCANIPAAREQMDISNASTRLWVSNSPVNLGGASTSLNFTPGNAATQGQPRAWFDSYTSGNTTIPQTWLALAMCCDGKLTFETGLPICGDDGNGPRTAPCPPDTFSVVFDCNCCPEDWDGPGWYCTLEEGCANYTDCPAGNITLLGGPYGNQSLCELNCFGNVTGIYCANFTYDFSGFGNCGNSGVIHSANFPFSECVNLGPYAFMDGWTLNSGPYESTDDCPVGCEGSGGFEFAEIWFRGWWLYANYSDSCGNRRVVLFIPTDVPFEWEAVNMGAGTAMGSCMLSGPVKILGCSYGSQQTIKMTFTSGEYIEKQMGGGPEIITVGDGNTSGICCTEPHYSFPLECGCGDPDLDQTWWLFTLYNGEFL